MNLYIIRLCTHLYHFFLVSVPYLQCIHCLLHYLRPNISRFGYLYLNHPNSLTITLIFKMFIFRSRSTKSVLAIVSAFLLSTLSIMLIALCLSEPLENWPPRNSYETTVKGKPDSKLIDSCSNPFNNFYILQSIHQSNSLLIS